jgi:arsenate reductase
MTVTVYHNPKCGTSRNVLQILDERGITPVVIEYLNTPPDRETLVKMIAESGLTVRQALRRKGSPYDELGLDDAKWADDELIDLMLKHPILINRPFVVTDKGSRLARPKETVLEIL